MERIKRFLNKNKIANSLLVFFLWAPMIQNETHWINEDGLGGTIIKIENPSFVLSEWFDGEYQTKMTDYCNHEFGFRNTLIRIHNQLDYFCFDKLHAFGVVMGKEEYLYEENYIRSCIGLDYVGLDKINEDARKLKLVQDTLRKLHVDLVFIIAPGKGTYFSEYFPSPYDTMKIRTTNYAGYASAFKQSGISYIDFNKWFLDMKKTTPYPLYGKGGIHWSKYGEALACDSLIRFIEQERECYMPRLVLDEVELSILNRDEDYDIGSALNLLFTLDTYSMGYPKFHFQKDQNKTKQKVICVADSYYWGMFNFGISTEVFGNGKYWYYNEQIYPDSYEKNKSTSEVDLKIEIEKHDVIIVLSTEMNLYRFSFGIVDQLYDVYYANNKSLFSKQ